MVWEKGLQVSAVSEFNPYREWLGIQTAGRPTYYQLLGLPLSETNDSTIRRRAEEQLARLQALGIEDEPALRKVMARIQRAAKCLTTPSERQRYDQSLREAVKQHNLTQSQRTAHDRPLPAKPKAAAGNADSGIVFPPAAFDGCELEQARNAETSKQANGAPSLPKLRTGKPGIAREVKKKQRRSRALTFSLALSGVSVLGITFLLVTQTDFASQIIGLTRQAVDAPSATRAPRGTMASDVDPAGPGDGPVLDSVDPAEPIVPAENPEETQPGEKSVPATAATADGQVTPAERKQLGELLSAARRALSNRDTDLARQLLQQAKPLARRADDQAKWARLAKLTQHVASYWQAAADQLRRLEAGHEIELAGQRVMVVEVDARRLILRAAGRNHEYQVDDLPSGLAVALADRWFDPNAASTKVFRGAMMAVSSEFDRADAKRVWREAAASGSIDLGDLELVLDDDYQLTE